MSDIVEIKGLGHAGDGVAADGLFVPYTVPGDVVRVKREGGRGRVDEILTKGAWRSEPPCRHFGGCGGCALQHVAREPYLAWKRDLVVTALRQRGFADVPVDDVRAVAPGTRRRASFKARATAKGVAVGFYERDSRYLVDLSECPILLPALANLMRPLREDLRVVLKEDETAEVLVTVTDTGVDASLKLKRSRSSDLLMALAEFAARMGFARLCLNGEEIAVANTPELRIGSFPVVLPPDAFLQPTSEGEHILQMLVREAAGDARRLADLFSGCGAFALRLAGSHTVHAIDSMAPQTEALLAAAKKGRAPVTTETRDLFCRPLTPVELARFDTVVLDPPRPGAQAQAQALAQSQVARVLYVSCNPASFARDARILCNGGYRLTRVVPLDQFLWSPHVELFALFTR